MKINRLFTLVGFTKLSGHLTSPRVFCYDEPTRYLVSGGEDTNVKVWDLRNPNSNRQCVTTFKSHTGSIACLQISPDSNVLISGAEDGTLIMYDLVQFKVIKSFKLGSPQSSYPICVGVQRHETYNVLCGFAVGLLNKTVKYFKVDQNQSNNPVN